MMHRRQILGTAVAAPLASVPVPALAAPLSPTARQWIKAAVSYYTDIHRHLLLKWNPIFTATTHPDNYPQIGELVSRGYLIFSEDGSHSEKPFWSYLATDKFMNDFVK